MSPHAAYLLASADIHERDGYAEIAQAMRARAWAVTGRRTLETVLRATVAEWDEETLAQHLDAADDAARRSA